MSKSKSKMSQAELRKFRSDVSKLRSKGLLPGVKDARKAQPNRYLKDMIRKYGDVLAGNAQVVSVPQGKASSYRGAFRTVGKNKVVVPAPAGGGRARYVASKKDIVVTTKGYGGTLTSSYRRYSLDELAKMEGKGTSFSISIPRGNRYEHYRKQTIGELANMFGQGSSFDNFDDWAQYVNVETYVPDVKTDADLEAPLSEPVRQSERPEGFRRRTKAKGRRKTNKRVIR